MLLRALGVADFNADGVLDMATVNEYSNNVSVLLGNGDRRRNEPKGFAWGDLNRDGRPDIAVASPGTGSAVVLINNKPLAEASTGEPGWGRGPDQATQRNYDPMARDLPI